MDRTKVPISTIYAGIFSFIQLSSPLECLKSQLDTYCSQIVSFSVSFLLKFLVTI